MFFKSARNDLDKARDNTQDFLKSNPVAEPKVLSRRNMGTFFSQVGSAARLIFQEPEILVFAMLQVLVIAGAYYIWVRMLAWIPDAVWDAVEAKSKSEREGGFTLINLALLGWSFLIVFVASYPIGIFSGAMVASYNLRSSGKISTMALCLKMALMNAGRLWVFTTLDAWITVRIILARLPKKKNDHSAADELRYYAWKIGTLGIVPALVSGKSFIQAGKQSFTLLTQQPIRVIGIRMGYSFVCWIVGIAAYIGSYYYYFAYGGDGCDDQANWVYKFYYLMGVPIMIAVAITSVLVRPFYLLMAANIYAAEFPLMNTEAAEAGSPYDAPEEKSYHYLTVVFFILLGLLLSAVYYDEKVGIKNQIEQWAEMDLSKEDPAYQHSAKHKPKCTWIVDLAKPVVLVNPTGTFQEAESEETANSNLFLVEKVASVPVAANIMPQQNLSGMTKEQILQKRIQAMAPYKHAMNGNYYIPFRQIYDGIADGMLWWGMEGVAVYGAGPKSIQGVSYRSNAILNPLALLWPDVWDITLPLDGKVLNTSRIVLNGKVDALFPYLPRPKQIEFYPARNEIVMHVNLTAYNAALEPYTHRKLEGQVPVHFEGVNARDLGYPFILFDAFQSTNFTKLTPLELSAKDNEYYHIGGSCGHRNGCNNLSPRHLACRTM